MKKNIKYGISLFSILLTLMLGYVAYAEDSSEATTTGGGKPSMEFKKGDDLRKMFEERKEQTAENREGFKDEVGAMRDELKTNREQYRTELRQMIEGIKVKREEFKAEMETKREEIQAKISEANDKFKESLKNIKDENKKVSAEKIVDLITELNTKMTDNLSDKVNQIENVLVSIESRISKAKDNGIDVSSLDSKVSDAKDAIEKARDSISTQANKVYEITVTDDTTLRTEMKTLRDTFKKDIEAVRLIVKEAHTTVKNVAVALAQIPKIDDTDDVDSSTDDNSTN